MIESRGGTATKEYIDNDKSAYKPEVIRDEGFEPWLQDFIDNKTDGIAGWDLWAGRSMRPSLTKT